jgi:hypothetical protein
MAWADLQSLRALSRFSKRAAPTRRRSRSPAPLVVLACVAAVAVGCGGRSPLDLPPEPSGAAGAPDDSSLSTPTGFCVEYEQRYLVPTRRCYGADVPADVLATIEAQVCQSLDASLAAGRLSYDRSRAVACLAQVDAALAASCRFDDVPCVDDVVAGLVPDGAPCSSSAECARRSDCVRPDRTTCAQAVCTPAGGVGAPCAAECAPGLMCSNDAANLCVADTGQVGTACDPTAVAPCDWSFACHSNGAGSATCREARTGDACVDERECPIEDFCDVTCKPRKAVGASCAASSRGCVALATCDPVTRRCVAAGTDGKPCGMNGFCYYGTCTATFTTGRAVCVVDRPTGAACDDPNECASGVCGQGTCLDCAP